MTLITHLTAPTSAPDQSNMMPTLLDHLSLLTRHKPRPINHSSLPTRWIDKYSRRNASTLTNELVNLSVQSEGEEEARKLLEAVMRDHWSLVRPHVEQPNELLGQDSGGCNDTRFEIGLTGGGYLVVSFISGGPSLSDVNDHSSTRDGCIDCSLYSGSLVIREFGVSDENRLSDWLITGRGNQHVSPDSDQGMEVATEGLEVLKLEDKDVLME